MGLQKYRPSFYRKLSEKEKEVIYNGVMTLANGFLSFQPLMAAGSGGGAISLTGRLLALHASYPYFLRIATDIAMKLKLINIERMGDPNDNEEDKIEEQSLQGQGVSLDDANIKKWLLNTELKDVSD